MARSTYTIRDDGHFRVVVGWDDALQTFFARIDDLSLETQTPIVAVGHREHEITTLSRLALEVAGYAPLDGDTITALRHDAAPVA